jgi:alpha-tubulin suppressor-like RCC1 family protein
MSQTKAQLIQPIGVVTAGGVVVTGVVTASSFDGDVVGTATSIISGANLNVGIISATNFSGDFTGTATGIKTGAAIKVGSFTATNFTGDFTGTATSMMRGTGFEAGAINATGFNVSGTTTGNVTGDITGNISGNVTGNVTGNVIAGTAGSVASGANIHVGVLTAITFSGDGSNLSGIAATNFNTQVVPDNKTFSINVTSPAGGNYTLSGTDRSGTVSGSSDPAVTVEIGDTLNFVVDASGHPFYIRVSDGGANVSTPAATNQGATDGTVSWTPNTAGTYYYQCGNHAGMLGTITVTSTTTIDLSSGNCITFNTSSSTTVSFANTSEAMDVTIIKGTGSGGPITWPDSVKWNGGTAPTVTTSGQSSDDAQQFQLITRDSGLTWYAWENMRDLPRLSGELWTWGTNQSGKLGQNQAYPGLNSSSAPIQIGTDTNWDQLATGGSAGWALGASAIKNDGTMWFWGYNYKGMFGSNGAVPINGARSSPVQLPGTWKVASNSYGTSIAVKTDGTLWSWGYNYDGNLGQNQAGANAYNKSSPVQVGTENTWTGTKDTLRTNRRNSFGIKTDGTLWAWGYNSGGRIGNGKAGPTDSNDQSYSSPVQLPGTDWAKVQGGEATSAAIKTDGTMWMWGWNQYGRLGQNQAYPGLNNISSPVQVPGTTWRSIKVGEGHAVATKTDGTLWTWGDNEYNALGQNNASTSDRSSPVQVPGTTWDKAIAGNTYTVATKTDGTLWTWGNNSAGMLGQGNTQGLSSPTQIPGTKWTGDLGFVKDSAYIIKVN